MKKLEVIKKILKSTCWSCEGKGCKVCHFTWQWEDSTYYHIITDKKGRKICFDGDSLK